MTEATARARPVTPMGIVAGRLGEICERARTSAVGDPEFVAALQQVHELAAGLEPYLAQSTSAESADLAQLSARTQAQDWSGFDGSSGLALEQEMLSGAVEGRLLRMLIRISGARRVLELGMFTGYSALAMAEALPEGGTVTACELDADVAVFAQQSFDTAAAGDRISVRVGPALQTLDDLAAEGASFDLVFIDADKAGYLDYLVTLLDADLLAPGGLICADNTLMQGVPWTRQAPTDAAAAGNGAAIAGFNSALAADVRVEQVLLPLRDGLTLIRRVDDEGGLAR